jgi:zeaxanthin glucosyltransferase
VTRRRVMRVLVVTLPEKGHYHPLLGPAAELVRRGADVTFAATFDIARELHAAGVARVAVPPGAPPPPDDVRGEALARVLIDPAELAGWIRRLLVESPRAGVEPLRAIVREVQPDVVAIDPMAYDAAIAAELEGVPWVGWSTSLNPVVAGDAESALIRTARSLDPDRHAVFADHGLTARFRVSDVLSPRGTAVFATAALTGPAPEESIHAATSPIHLVGPSLGGTRGGEAVDFAFAGQRPIVYVSFGSQAWYQPRRFDRVLAAAEALDVAVLAAMGDLAADYQRRAPPHVCCVGFADQLAALRHAAMIVTHGGANSIMEACAAGVPVLVAPICNDQPHNARFVERAGSGLALDLDRCSHAELVAALRRLLADGPERSAMRAVAASYATHSGARGAAELVERACG